MKKRVAGYWISSSSTPSKHCRSSTGVSFYRFFKLKCDGHYTKKDIIKTRLGKKTIRNAAIDRLNFLHNSLLNIHKIEYHLLSNQSSYFLKCITEYMNLDFPLSHEDITLDWVIRKREEFLVEMRGLSRTIMDVLNDGINLPLLESDHQTGFIINNQFFRVIKPISYSDLEYTYPPRRFAPRIIKGLYGDTDYFLKQPKSLDDRESLCIANEYAIHKRMIALDPRVVPNIFELSDIQIPDRLNTLSCIRMEYIKSGDLLHQIKSCGNLLLLDSIVRQLIDIVNLMHHHSIFHRDIKPENILLADGAIKLTDFGLSVSFKNKHDATETLPILNVGTVGYMHPSAFNIPKSLYTLKRSDFFALGITLLELIRSKIIQFPKALSSSTLMFTQINKIICSIERSPLPPIKQNILALAKTLIGYNLEEENLIFNHIPLSIPPLDIGDTPLDSIDRNEKDYLKTIPEY